MATCKLDRIKEIKQEAAIVHCSSLVEAPDESLLCVWYQGPYETSPQTVIKIARKGPKDASWQEDKTLFDFHGMPLGNPVLWRFENESAIHIVFSALIEESWERGFLFYSKSTDSGVTWEKPSLFLPYLGFVAKTKPVLTSKKHILFPLYHEGTHCPYIMIIRDLDKPLSANLVAETMARGKVIQPTLLKTCEDTFLLFGRTNQGHIWQSISYNHGLSWNICTPTNIPNPDSAIDMTMNQNKEIILVFNNSSSNRNNLSIALSEDSGGTWPYLREIISGEGEFSYPSMVLDSNNAINITFTENRYIINQVSVTTEWIKEAPLTVPLQT